MLQISVKSAIGFAMNHIHEAISRERWGVVEIPIKHKDGTVRILLWNSATVYASDGKNPIATIAQGQDTTDCKIIGLSKQYLVEKLFRDARETLICDASNHILEIAGGYDVVKKYPRS